MKFRLWWQSDHGGPLSAANFVRNRPGAAAAVNLQIINEDGALASLVDCLSELEMPELHVIAVNAKLAVRGLGEIA